MTALSAVDAYGVLTEPTAHLLERRIVVGVARYQIVLLHLQVVHLLSQRVFRLLGDRPSALGCSELVRVLSIPQPLLS